MERTIVHDAQVGGIAGYARERDERPAEDRLPHVANALAALEHEYGRLVDAVEVLYGKVEPILGPATPTVEEQLVRPNTGVALADNLHGLCGRLAGRIDELQAMARRVEL
jgi:hypothetical protein